MTAAPFQTDGECLLASILFTPEDDAPRLQYADWLDEHEQPERAEFIRVQCELARTKVHPQGHFDPSVRSGINEAAFCKRDDCRACELRHRERELLGVYGEEWIRFSLGNLADDPQCFVKWDGLYRRVGVGGRIEVGVEFRRGFVDELRCRLAAFMGGACDDCDGTGKDASLPDEDWTCKTCRGAGRTPGAVEVFRTQPVRSVVLTDCEPWENDSDDPPSYRWQLEDRREGPHRELGELPENLIRLIPYQKKHKRGDRLTEKAMDILVRSLDTADAAKAALSAACVRYGRRLAGIEDA